MKDDFKAIHQALLDATQNLIASQGRLVEANVALVETNARMIALGEALTRATTATGEARDEHEDLRETVARLEALINELLRRQTP